MRPLRRFFHPRLKTAEELREDEERSKGPSSGETTPGNGPLLPVIQAPDASLATYAPAAPADEITLMHPHAAGGDLVPKKRDLDSAQGRKVRSDNEWIP